MLTLIKDSGIFHNIGDNLMKINSCDIIDSCYEVESKNSTAVLSSTGPSRHNLFETVMALQISLLSIV